MYFNTNCSDADTQIPVPDYLTLIGSECLTLGPLLFNTRWKNAGTHWKESGMGPKTGGDVWVKWKFSSCCRKSKSLSPSPYRTGQKYEHDFDILGSVHIFAVWKTRGCQCSFRLLIMGGVSPETCWALYKYGIIKLSYTIPSGFIFFNEVNTNVLKIASLLGWNSLFFPFISILLIGSPFLFLTS
jgi:hypothetical protein